MQSVLIPTHGDAYSFSVSVSEWRQVDFSLCTPDITELLLKVALNSHNPNQFHKTYVITLYDIQCCFNFINIILSGVNMAGKNKISPVEISMRCLKSAAQKKPDKISYSGSNISLTPSDLNDAIMGMLQINTRVEPCRRVCLGK
jgi:hypothetical protein